MGSLHIYNFSSAEMPTWAGYERILIAVRKSYKTEHKGTVCNSMSCHKRYSCRHRDLIDSHAAK